MAARSGEQAIESGRFHCERCGHSVRVNQGDPIPRCPSCGNTTYDRRTGEPD